MVEGSVRINAVGPLKWYGSIEVAVVGWWHWEGARYAAAVLMIFSQYSSW